MAWLDPKEKIQVEKMNDANYAKFFAERMVNIFEDHKFADAMKVLRKINPNAFESWNAKKGFEWDTNPSQHYNSKSSDTLIRNMHLIDLANAYRIIMEQAGQELLGSRKSHDHEYIHDFPKTFTFIKHTLNKMLEKKGGISNADVGLTFADVRKAAEAVEGILEETIDQNDFEKYLDRFANSIQELGVGSPPPTENWEARSRGKGSRNGTPGGTKM